MDVRHDAPIPPVLPRMTHPQHTIPRPALCSLLTTLCNLAPNLRLFNTILSL